MLGSRLIARGPGRGAAWRWRACAIALLCVLGQTSALVHRALVQHATCAEHGESVHVAAVSAAVVALGQPHFGTEQPLATGTAVGETDQHEHCAFAHTRSATPRLLPDGTQQTVEPRAGALPPNDAVPGTGVASYLIAPKTSPPRAAS